MKTITKGPVKSLEILSRLFLIHSARSQSAVLSSIQGSKAILRSVEFHLEPYYLKRTFARSLFFFRASLPTELKSLPSGELSKMSLIAIDEPLFFEGNGRSTNYKELQNDSNYRR
ncbi:hypothetical protein BFP71_00080 [Roseivirga misakiensis]|uniref:Uncharacterized protein n=1 Tax=Roseivirga misakiensis TaxID=1563681 RepID=A0A1E5T7S9_9BACT|nr:hypothetical protein BFP71_00080 [Roseivirga misakiensis]